jgi:hypothetical protein
VCGKTYDLLKRELLDKRPAIKLKAIETITDLCVNNVLSHSWTRRETIDCLLLLSHREHFVFDTIDSLSSYSRSLTRIEDALINACESECDKLIEALRQKGRFDRSKCVSRLVQIGKPAVEPLCQVVRDCDSYALKPAVYVLGEIGDTRAIIPLLELWLDDFIRNDALYRDELSDALEKLCDIGTLESLCDAFGSTEWCVRNNAVANLAAIAIAVTKLEPNITVMLSGLLNSATVCVRLNAVEALARIKDIEGHRWEGSGQPVWKYQPYYKNLSALNYAALVGDIEMVGAFLKDDCDMICPLFLAAKRGHANVVEMLINRGADVNAICSHVNECGRVRPLTAALKGGHTDVAEFLRRHGAHE